MRNNIFRLILLVFGFTMGFALMAALELGCRASYFNHTYLGDPEAIASEKRVVLGWGTGPWKLKAGETKEFVFPLPPEERGRFVDASIEISGKAPGQSDLSLEVADEGKVLATVSSDGILNKLQARPFVSAEMKKVWVRLKLAPGAKPPGTIHNLQVFHYPIVKLTEFFKRKQIFEWHWTRADLLKTMRQRAFPRTTDPLPTDPRPRVFAFGGSTTHGMKVPPAESYPAYLHQRVNAALRGTVYNYGIPGVSSESTNSYVKNIAHPFSGDIVVLHDGYNDLPIVMEQQSPNQYRYISPGDRPAFNPYDGKALTGFLRLNLWSTRNHLRDNFKWGQKMIANQGHLFLGYDEALFPSHTGGEAQIAAENANRIKNFIGHELDSIDFALSHNMKVVVVLEPNVQPNWAPWGTGFRDIRTGTIQRKNHIAQQKAYAEALKKYSNESRVAVVDLRATFEKDYQKYYYDECHLYSEGNRLKAEKIFLAIDQLSRPELLKLSQN